jgi:hypothetical protein
VIEEIDYTELVRSESPVHIRREDAVDSYLLRNDRTVITQSDLYLARLARRAMLDLQLESAILLRDLMRRAKL